MTDEAAQPTSAASTAPPPPYDPPPPADDQPPAAAPPPWFGAGAAEGDRPSFSRDKLVRPQRPRYLAGVSGALGNATNTDPVLWRVLLAVLGLFGGAGVLLYLIGWLAIPAENDTASPIESLLGRGRSGMKPLSIVLLGGATVLTFVFVVNDGFRAALLAVAVLIGAALLLKRNNPALFSSMVPPAPAAAAPPAQPFPPQAPAAPEAPTAPVAPEAPAAPEPPTEEIADEKLPPRPPTFAPPTSGFRPPFAPHGPFAGPPPPPAPPAKAQKPPKPPKEKSKLGSATFFGLILVMGCVTLIDLAGVSVPVSAYFAAALATIALGLIVGGWFGRARGLIALAVLATLGLAVSTGIERVGGQVGSNVYRPSTLNGVADRYDFNIGNAVLDLRRVDFANADQTTTVEMKLGQIQVLLPPNVDTTADVGLNEGRAVVFGHEYDARQAGAQPFTDLGPDGAGGGTLHLNIVMNTGNVEVTR